MKNIFRKISDWLSTQSSVPDLTINYKPLFLPIPKKFNTFDIDGVILIADGIGVYPGPNDVLITGRSIEEKPETLKSLNERGIKNNHIFFQNVPFDKKNRIDSGKHKAETLNFLLDKGYEIGVHFEDDEIQLAQINKYAPRVKTVHIVHDLTEKENVRRNSNLTKIKLT